MLSPGDRRSLCTLLAGPRMSPRTPLTQVQGIQIQRGISHGPRRIYRVFGSGAIESPAEVAFEALSNLSLIPAWDVLFKGARYLEFSREAVDGGVLEVGRIHLVYGLPGVSRIIHDRDFVLRAVRVFFPSGVCALCCRSVGADEAEEGDPGPSRHMIRGWMWSSGYVVVPTDPDSCIINISLQVDPKGWIPSAIVNMSLEAIPLNIARLRGALARLPPELAERLGALNLQQAARAKPLAARPTGATAAGAPGSPSAGAGAGGSTSGDSDSNGEADGTSTCWEPARETWDEPGRADYDYDGASAVPKRARRVA